MTTQLKTLRLDSKGKSSEKMRQAVSELEYLTTFNRSISQAMARTMQDLSEEEISKSEERRLSGTSHRHQGRFHPYAASDKSTSHHTDKKNVPAWKQIKDKQQARRGRGKASTFSQKPAKGSKSHK